MIALNIWIRGTWPRVRVDQLMGFAWKILLPMSLINIVAVGIWHYTASKALAWIVTAIILDRVVHPPRKAQRRRNH